MQCYRVNTNKESKMKVNKSLVERSKSFSKLPSDNITLMIKSSSGDVHTELVFASFDVENDKMYILHASELFYPIPSWGIELPLNKGTTDISSYRGLNGEEANITYSKEAYEAFSRFIDEEDNTFNMGMYRYERLGWR